VLQALAQQRDGRKAYLPAIQQDLCGLALLVGVEPVKEAALRGHARQVLADQRGPQSSVCQQDQPIHVQVLEPRASRRDVTQADV
jgi:hypothetical protein